MTSQKLFISFILPATARLSAKATSWRIHGEIELKGLILRAPAPVNVRSPCVVPFIDLISLPPIINKRELKV